MNQGARPRQQDKVLDPPGRPEFSLPPSCVAVVSAQRAGVPIAQLVIEPISCLAAEHVTVARQPVEELGDVRARPPKDKLGGCAIHSRDRGPLFRHLRADTQCRLLHVGVDANCGTQEDTCAVGLEHDTCLTHIGDHTKLDMFFTSRQAGKLG